jgi:hypothetical protein
MSGCSPESATGCEIVFNASLDNPMIDTEDGSGDLGTDKEQWDIGNGTLVDDGQDLRQCLCRIDRHRMGSHGMSETWRGWLRITRGE